MTPRFHLFLLFFTVLCPYHSYAQQNGTTPAPNNSTAPASAPAPLPPPPPPPPFAATTNFCSDGVGVLYSLQSIIKSYPINTDPAEQPYTFTADLEIFNAGEEDLKGWEVYIDYVNKEILVSAGGALIADGSQLPYNASEGVSLTSTSSILKTGIDSAMDYTQMGVSLVLKGTEFGQNQTSMPRNISLTTPGYSCGALTRNVNTLGTCCIQVNSTVTLDNSTFLPRYTGDITISYDVRQAYTDNYWAQVTMSNNNPIGRLDFWNLNWDWQNGEFIYAMKGAETTEQDLIACLGGSAGTNYQTLDFNQAMSCQSTPTIIDLDQYKANDSNVGKIEYCCRNGTLLSSVQDPSKSKSVFQLQVYKLPPQNQNLTLIDPPINWRISGLFDPDYTCDQPRLVEPTAFPDPASAQRTEEAIMSWQVTCNITLAASTPRKCCVSYSSYDNTSVVPCKTCACGCSSSSFCNQSAEALLIPVELATVPTVNRTTKALAWAKLNGWPVPAVLPCPDNCGVSINWHLLSSVTNGWSARVTLFNWQGLQFADWSAAVQLGASFGGFQQAYSFNYSVLDNNTIFMYGLEGLNYLNGISNNYPGIQQSVLSFAINATTGTGLSRRDFFPSKVFFGGDECALPDILPSGESHKLYPGLLIVVTLWFLLFSCGPGGLL